MSWFLALLIHAFIKKKQSALEFCHTLYAVHDAARFTIHVVVLNYMHA